MQDPEIQAATASEALSLQEEYDMQSAQRLTVIKQDEGD